MKYLARMVKPTLVCLGAWMILISGAHALDLRAYIEASNRSFVEAMNTGDLDKVVAHFSNKGAVLPPNQAPALGKEAVTEFWRVVMSAGLNASLETIEVVQFGTHAYELGYYFLSSAQGVVVDDGKYIVIWQLENKGWKMYRDIFNSSRTLPSTAE